jgi:hypothetical protein
MWHLWDLKMKLFGSCFGAAQTTPSGRRKAYPRCNAPWRPNESIPSMPSWMLEP